MTGERKIPPKPKNPFDPIAFTLEGESKQEWVSSATGHASARILPDRVVILSSTKAHEFKQPAEIIIREPNVTAVAFLGKDQDQIACATSQGVTVWELKQPDKYLRHFAKPRDITDYHVVQMGEVQNPGSASDSLVTLLQASKTSPIYMHIIDLKGKTSSIAKLNNNSELDANRAIIEENRTLLFIDDKSDLQRFYISTGEKCGYLGRYFENPKGATIINLCCSYHELSPPPIAATYWLSETDHPHAFIKFLDKRTMKGDNLELPDHVDPRIQPKYIGEDLFYLKDGTDEIRCFNPLVQTKTSTLVFHTSFKNPRRLFAAGEGIIGVEGHKDKRVQCEIFPYSPEAIKIYSKYAATELLKDVRLSPDIANVVMSYVADDIAIDDTYVGKMDIGSCSALFPIGQDHRFFSDGSSPCLWDARRISEAGEMQYRLMPLDKPGGIDKPGGRSFFISLRKDLIGQISTAEQKLIVHRINEADAEESFTRINELPFQIKATRGDESLLSYQLPDGRVIVASDRDNLIQLINPEKLEKKSVKNDECIHKMKIELDYSDLITQIQFIPPNFILITKIHGSTIYELSSKDSGLFGFFKDKNQFLSNGKDIYLETSLELAHPTNTHFWMINNSRALVSSSFHSLEIRDFDPKTLQFKNVEKIADLRPEYVELLPNGNALIGIRHYGIDIMMYDSKTNKLNILMESTQKKCIDSFFLIEGETIGIFIQDPKNKKNLIEFYNIPEIVNLYSQRAEIEEKRSGPSKAPR